MKTINYDNSGAYQEMARFYDTLMGSNKYPGWKDLIKDVLNKYSVKTGLCLDIACGTGNISRLVAELGFEVVGLDLSMEMIKIAKDKIPSGDFIKADIRDFNLPLRYQSKIDLVVCFYDSLNYLLTDRELLDTFKSVYRNIQAGSIFIFDMNPMDHILTAQKFKPRINEDKNFFSTFCFSGEGRFWILDMDFFVKNGNCFNHFKERHVERGYDQEDVLPLLKETGFKVLEVRTENKIYEDKQEHLSRLYFIVQK